MNAMARQERGGGRPSEPAGASHSEPVGGVRSGTAGGRRQRQRSPAKRRAILAAATEAFLGHGYARTSVDSVAAAAGVGKQTVYGHFGDKKQLFLAAVAEARAQAAAEAGATDGELTDTGDPLADLTVVGERILDVALSPTVAALHRLTIAELAHHPELQEQWRATSTPDADGEVAKYLRAADAAGLLTVPDPVQAARQFAYLLIGEARVDTLHGTTPLNPRRRHEIAASAASLIVRANRANR